MRVLFLIPPSDFNPHRDHVDRVYGCNYGYDYKPPIHMLTAATAVERAGHAVRFVDFPAERLEAAALEGIVTGFRPDAVCFFSVYLSHVEDREASRIVARLSPRTWSIFMGTYPSWKPEHYIEKPGDLVIRGEPEGTLQELLRVLEESGSPAGVRGVSHGHGGSIRHEDPRDLLDVNTLPAPNRRLLMGRYTVNRLNVHPATTMCTSRGCSYHCTFCAPNAVDQAIELERKRFRLPHPGFRFKSEEGVIAEFRAAAEAGAKGIEIADNMFVFRKDRTIRICEAIAPLGLKWLCLARANHLQDEETIEAMARAGCTLVYIGSESFCQEILDDVCKHLTPEEVRSAVAKLQRHGIEPEISVVLGASALETRETVRRSLRTARLFGTRFTHFSIALPFPNTQLYETAKERGWLKHGEFVPVDNARESIVDLPNLKGEELEKILKNAYLRQYFSPGNILAQIRRVKSLRDFLEKARLPFRFLWFYVFGHGVSAASAAGNQRAGGDRKE